MNTFKATLVACAQLAALYAAAAAGCAVGFFGIEALADKLSKKGN